jgi:hypothetical protein
MPSRRAKNRWFRGRNNQISAIGQMLRRSLSRKTLGEVHVALDFDANPWNLAAHSHCCQILLAGCRLIRPFVAAIMLAWPEFPAVAAGLDAAAINNAGFPAKPPAEDKIDAAVVKAQVLLDRARFSPGQIDGKLGASLRRKALPSISRPRRRFGSHSWPQAMTLDHQIHDLRKRCEGTIPASVLRNGGDQSANSTRPHY